MIYCVTIELDIDVSDSTPNDQLGRAIRTVLDQPLTAQVIPAWSSEDDAMMHQGFGAFVQRVSNNREQDIAVPAADAKD